MGYTRSYNRRGRASAPKGSRWMRLHYPGVCKVCGADMPEGSLLQVAAVLFGAVGPLEAEAAEVLSRHGLDVEVVAGWLRELREGPTPRPVVDAGELSDSGQ